MTDVTKARLKIARGYVSGANAIAGACGFGALSFVTGNHHRTAHSIRAAAASLQSAQQTIRDGKRDLDLAKERQG